MAVGVSEAEEGTPASESSKNFQAPPMEGQGRRRVLSSEDFQVQPSQLFSNSNPQGFACCFFCCESGSDVWRWILVGSTIFPFSRKEDAAGELFAEPVQG